MSKKILLIDGMALLFRHFYATSVNKQYMFTSKGLPTNGTQGFIRHIYTAIKQSDPTHVAVCWDMGKATFRNEIFEGYKQNRTEPPEALLPQFDHVKHISEALGFHNIGVSHYEADDVIGTIASHYKDVEDAQVVIVTGDRDLLQCASKNVEIWLIKKGFTEYVKVDEQAFIAQYALQPKQLIDIKAFMGDSADGYPGVKGIGEKTAIKLIQAYHSVEGVLENMHHLTPGQQKKIQTHLDDLKLSKRLARIEDNVPINFKDLEQYLLYEHNIMHALRICEAHELRVSHRYLRSLF
ncbi:5'-3' exonuclease [Staphylococcus agnetis]|uniref:5'-3' exonuclease n=1 Tax=Staphylococcus agnetis TaxID=985762 RepID=UPI000D043CC2|nr:5'-3' exonuclease [Staphylococcus agnetis]UXU53997.1 5'-3' exonuclease [Staphylococcus agnetis]UXU63224.1 5'-3' exonuclease [Staphylococcus agnetis]UXU65563.1 5'-3' exonuclease [Staphylococcus agnetis]